MSQKYGSNQWMFMHWLKIMMILITIYFVNLFVLGQNFGQSNSVEKLSTFSSLVWEDKSDTVTDW